MRQRDPTSEYADQSEAFKRRGVAFEDLVRDPLQRTVYAIFGEYFGEGRFFGVDAVRTAVPTSVGDR